MFRTYQALCWLVLQASTAAAILGQEPLGEVTPSVSAQHLLSAQVSDPAGRPVAGAEILISKPGSGGHQILQTDLRGRFQIQLREGNYQIEVHSPGFATWNGTVELAAAHHLEIALTLAALAETVSVTATRNLEPESRTAQSVAVLGWNEIHRRQPMNVTQLLADLPGLYFTESGSFRTRPILRGLDSNRVLILVDGQRLNNARTSTLNAGIEPALVDPHQLERIEVSRGAGSVLYGSDAMAGVINLITRQSQHSSGLHLGGSFLSEYFSASDGRRFHSSISASASRWSLRLGGSISRFENYKSADGTVPNSSADDDNLDGVFSLKLTSADQVRVQWTRRRGGRIGVPGLAESGPFFAEFPFDNRDKVALIYERRQPAGHLERIQTHFFWQDQERNFFNRVRSSRFSLSSSTVTDTRTIGYDLQMTHVPGSDHRLTFGTSFFEDQNSDLREQIIFPGTPRARLIDQAPSVPDSTLQGIGAFLQDQWSVTEKWLLNLGIRIDRFHTSAEPTANFQGPIGEPKTNVSVSGNLGVIYQLSSQVGIFGRLGRAFREPNLFERFFFGRGSVGGLVVPNPELEPEVAFDSEGGIRFTRGSLRFSANYFHNRISNLITTVPSTFMGQTTFGDQPVSTHDNIDNARIQGVEAELEASWSMAGGWWIFYSRHSAQRGSNLTSDEPLPLIVPYRTLSGLRWYGMSGRITQEVEVEAVHGGERVPPGTPPLSGFTVYNWRGEFRLFDRTGFFGAQVGLPQTLRWSLENFTDKLYRPLFNRVAAEGLNLKIQLLWKF